MIENSAQDASGMVRVSFDREQLQAFKREAAYGKPYADRVSLGLAFRLVRMYNERSDYFAVLDELDHLEGLTQGSKTKPESQFRYAPLHPLWHKHFSSARHVATNIFLRWQLGGKAKPFNAVVRKIAEENDNDWQARLADVFVMQGYQDRARDGITGDWIIFGKHEGRNYYLDLATHTEGEPENAPQLLQKLKSGSAAEFPFLFSST